jgi:serine/arginine repetitive matrix protein 2
VTFGVLVIAPTHTASPPRRLTTSLLHRLTASPIHRLTDSPHRLTAASPIHRLTASPSHRRTASPIHRPTASPSHRFTASPPHRLTTSPPHRLTAAPPHRLTASPPHRLAASSPNRLPTIHTQPHTYITIVTLSDPMHTLHSPLHHPCTPTTTHCHCDIVTPYALVFLQCLPPPCTPIHTPIIIVPLSRRMPSPSTVPSHRHARSHTPIITVTW